MIKLKTSTKVPVDYFETAIEAIEAGRTSDVLQLISLKPSLLEKEKYHPTLYVALNLLDFAALKGDVTLVKVLINKGLLVARKVIQQPLVPEVLEALKGVKYKLVGPFPVYINRRLGTSDMSSAMASSFGAVKLLIVHDANYLNDEETLKLAIDNGNLEIIKFLLEEGVHLNIKKVLPLLAQYANIERCSPEMLQLLLSFGAGNDRNINVKTLDKLLKGNRHDKNFKTRYFTETIRLFMETPIDWESYGSQLIQSALRYFPAALPYLLFKTEKITAFPVDLLYTIITEYESLSIEQLQSLLSRCLTSQPRKNALALSILLDSPTFTEKQKFILTFMLRCANIDWNFLNHQGLPLLHLLMPHHAVWIPDFCQAGADINQINSAGLTLLHVLALDKKNIDAKNIANILFRCHINPVIRNSINTSNGIKIKNVTAFQLAYIEDNDLLSQALTEYTERYAKFCQLDQQDMIIEQKKQLQEYYQKLDQNQLQQSNTPLETLHKLKQERNEIVQQLCEKDALIAQILKQIPVPAYNYNQQDIDEIKGMLRFYVGALAKYPSQVSELLKHVAVSVPKNREEITAIIQTAFAGKPISEDTLGALLANLAVINNDATKLPKELRVKSKLNYAQEDIAKIVHDDAMECVMNKQEKINKKAIADAEARYEVKLQAEIEKLKKEHEAAMKEAIDKAIAETKAKMKAKYESKEADFTQKSPGFF